AGIIDAHIYFADDQKLTYGVVSIIAEKKGQSAPIDYSVLLDNVSHERSSLITQGQAQEILEYIFADLGGSAYTAAQSQMIAAELTSANGLLGYLAELEPAHEALKLLVFLCSRATKSRDVTVSPTSDCGVLSTDGKYKVLSTHAAVTPEDIKF